MLLEIKDILHNMEHCWSIRIRIKHRCVLQIPPSIPVYTAAGRTDLVEEARHVRRQRHHRRGHGGHHDDCGNDTPDRGRVEEEFGSCTVSCVDTTPTPIKY